MNDHRKSALQRMDALVRWSGAAEAVSADMAADADTRRRHQPMRWLPLLPMACGAGLIGLAIAHPIASTWYVAAGPMVAAMTMVSINGPLGKPSLDDDEREAALRKDAFLFCFAVLAILNMLAGPALMVMAGLNAWAIEQMVGVAFALAIGNVAWFGSLPTLYASWKSPHLSNDE